VSSGMAAAVHSHLGSARNERGRAGLTDMARTHHRLRTTEVDEAARCQRTGTMPARWAQAGRLSVTGDAHGTYPEPRQEGNSNLILSN